MTAVYIVGYVGTGAHDDPFRPRTNGEQGWAALDFRPDPTLVNGFALLRLHQRATDETGMEHLGGWDDTLANNQRYNQIEDFFGIERSALRGLTVRQILRDLMTVHADADTQSRGRWKKVAPSRDGWTRIIIGGETIWEEEGEPRPASVSHSESWPTIGNLGAVTQDQTWVSITGQLGNWEVFTAGVLTHDASSFMQIVMQAQADTHDNECNGVAIRVDRDEGNFAQAFFGARCAPDAFTGYFVRIDHSGGDRRMLLRRYVAGSATDLGSVINLTWDAPHDIRVRVDGSTITGWQDDTLIATETDTVITEGRNTILGAVRHISALRVQLGPLTFGDVVEELTNAYLIFRRTPSTGEPFDPEVDMPIATVPPEQLTYDDEGLAEGEYDWQVFARKVE